MDVPRIRVSTVQARRFLLSRHGLLGPHRFAEPASVVRELGPLQFDPVDVCGRTSDISLAARIPDYAPRLAEDALYGPQRTLLDHFDKEMCIVALEDWPALARVRSHARVPEPAARHGERVLERVRAHGPVCAADLAMSGSAEWEWSTSSLARIVLETLYRRGDLVVAHRRGRRKYYDLACRHIPEGILRAPDPHPSADAYADWKILRRIRSIGLLWNRSSPAWLGTSPHRGALRAGERAASIARLEEAGRIAPVAVEGIPHPFYVATAEIPRLAEAADHHVGDRLELLGPLDTMLWDRDLVRAIFGFSYTWEIYTPAPKRKYAAYALPMVEGDRIVGRLAAHRDGAAIVLDEVWYEPEWRRTRGHAARLRGALARLGASNSSG